MAFPNMLRDRVTLVKQDGRRFDNVRASVQSNRILTDDPRLPIEEGDTFERRLPSGLIESYFVTDRGFITESGGIASHYQTKVRKSRGDESLSGSQTIEPKLFLSHSSTDVEIVKLLVDLLLTCPRFMYQPP